MLAFPNVAIASRASDTDIVIVGAGAAGLAAARTLQSSGLRFELIEIRDRIGGRAHTDTEYFGVPVDFGCSEIHHAHLNPWIAYARQNDFTVGRLPGDTANSVFDGSRTLSAKESSELAQAFRQHQRALVDSCANGRDISVADAVAHLDGNEWSPSVRLWLGPITAGVDAADWSAQEWCNGVSGENWYAPAGFGRLVAHYGRAVPVSLNTRATEILWTGNSVTVRTNRGDINAKAAIVTVPIGVLQSDFIKFTPPLPAWMTRALDGMVMAKYIRILLKLDRDIFGQPDGSWIAHKTAGRDGFSFWVNPGGHGVTHAIAGGEFALELELSGADEAVDTALAALKGLLGRKVDQAFVEGTISIWSQDPFARGAWAQAKPGHFRDRKTLLRPLGGRVYFAGEANHDRVWATAAGATLVGRSVAGHIVKIFNRL